MTNTKKILPIAILIISLSLTFIIAEIVMGPTSYSSVDEDVSYKYNITINNSGASGNITTVNITLPAGFVFTAGTNVSNLADTFTNTSSGDTTVLSWSNITGVLINATGQNQSFIFNATMLTAGAWHNITVKAINTTNNYTLQNIAIYINDTTFPNVTSVTSPVHLGNYSGDLILNFSITDDTPNLVYFNLTNYSGTEVTGFWSNSTASRISGSSDWNYTLDTGNFTDGLYNVTIYVNDSNNQITFNGTTQFRIDNTNPTNTNFYCTPASVYVGEIVTCDCTGAADTGGSGVLTTVFTASPSTATTGTITQTCTITDQAGNSYAPTTTFIVNSRPSGGGLSGGSGSSTTTQQWTMTYKANDEQLTTGYTKSMAAKERVKVRVGNEDHHVGIKSVTTTSATIEIASDPIEIILDIGEDAKIDVNDDGVYDIYVILNNIVDNKADITITKIVESIPEGVEEPVTTTGEIVTPETLEPTRNYTWIWIVVIVLAIIIGIGYKYKKK